MYLNGIDSKESKDGINVGVFEGYSAFVDKNTFLCLRFRNRDFSNSDREVGEFLFYIFNYETSGKDRLIIKNFSNQKVKELIKDGKLKGKIVKRQYVDDITVTSSSDELVGVISNEGVGAFIEKDPNDVLVFSKLGK